MTTVSRSISTVSKINDLKEEIARLNDVITVDKKEINGLKSELKLKAALVRDLTNATDTWSHHFNELSELADENLKEVEDLRLKNTQLKRWVMNLVKSRQKVKADYSHDMRRITEYSQTLTAITEQYSNKYAQHILETPLPE